MGIHTFTKELVSSKESSSRAGVVGLEDQFQTLMNRQDWLGNLVSTQTSFKVHSVVYVDCKHVHVVKQAPAAVMFL